MNWTSGVLYSDEEAAAFDAKEARDAARLTALRINESLPLVYFDIEIKVHHREG